MTTPTHSELVERARELWFQDRLRREGAQALETNPEIEELREEGFILAAQQELMRSSDSYAEHIEKEYAETQRTGKAKFAKLKVQPFTVDVEETIRSGIFICGTRQIGKTTLGFCIAEWLIANGVVVFILDPTQAWLRFSGVRHTLHIYSREEKQQIRWREVNTLFDTSMLSPKDQQAFIELFCATVLNKAIRRPKHQRPNIVVVFEECHTPMPNHALYSNRCQQTVRLITQGGNFNISFIAITQFPSMCDKLLVKAPQQRFCGRTSEKNDKDYLRSFLDDKTEQLETLEVGEFLYFNCGNVTKRRNQIPLSPAKWNLEAHSFRGLRLM